jgi:multicomponent Na+:H+ antiporter subunit B
VFIAGVMIIVGSGIVALLFGQQLFSQAYVHLHVPLFGDIGLASALVFDIGIYCVVVGGLLTIFSVVAAE